MTLKFHDTDWARLIFSLIGGPGRAGGNLRHPATGKMELKRFVVVLFDPDSMVPTLHDGRDRVNHNKWFFGKGPKPQFDRWRY